MKKIAIMVAALASTALSGAWALSLADAAAGIGDAINNPSAITEAVKQLSSSDKTAYLAKVNEAIAKLPGSEDEKAAKYLEANTAAMKAMKGAAKEETLAMLAEVYATVPPEALTLVNESFASTLFSRSAGNVSDEAMKNIALEAMDVIKARNAGNDNESVRDGFAILMFIRASGGSPADLRQALTDTLPSQEAREVAATEWFPAALGEGREKSYEPMLAVANVVKYHETNDLLALAGDNIFNGSLLADLASANGVFSDIYADDRHGANPYSTVEKGLYNVPRTLNPDARNNPSYRRGGGSKGSNAVDPSDIAGGGDDDGDLEPIYYNGQIIGWRRRR